MSATRQIAIRVIRNFMIVAAVALCWGLALSSWVRAAIWTVLLVTAAITTELLEHPPRDPEEEE